MQLQLPDMPKQITKSESKILDYISMHTEEFLFSPISTISRKLNVSMATISRFVRHVGCQDYKELKKLVIEQTASEGPAAKMAATLSEDVGFTLESWILQQQKCLQNTLDGLDREAFHRAVCAVISARRVFIHAKSASLSLGQLLFYRLRRLGVEVILLPSGGSEVLEGLAQVQSGDMVMMFSFSKVSTEGTMILQHQKEIGYRTVAFCSRSFIPEEEKADIQLYVCRGEPQEYHSMTAAAAVVDALVVAVSEQVGVESARRLSRLHRWKKKYTPDGSF